MYQAGEEPHNTPWRLLWVALGSSIVGTAVLRGVPFAIQDNVWWLAVGGAVSLFAGSVFLGRRIGGREPLYGAILAGLYFGIAAVVILCGSALESLPDPLRGLSIGDSTFYLVSPPVLLLGGVLGSVAAGRTDRSAG